MNTFMIHANIEFLNFWNFLISETYSFSEHFRSSIKIYRSYQVISRDLLTTRSGCRPVQNLVRNFLVLVRICPRFLEFGRYWSEPALDFTFFWSSLERIGLSPWIPGHINESLYRWTGFKKEVRPKWKDTVDSNRTVFKYSFQLPFDVKFKKLELQIESGTELRK